MRKVAARLLKARGYEVIEAADGEEAFEKLSSFEPHLMISDLRMPRLTGMDLLRRLREEARPAPVGALAAGRRPRGHPRQGGPGQAAR